jgi:hypothetical protein
LFKYMRKGIVLGQMNKNELLDVLFINNNEQ